MRCLFVLVCISLLFSCAKVEKKPAHKKLPPATGKPSVEVPERAPLPTPAQTYARPSTEDALTPQRQASMRLVDRGRALLETEEFDRAAVSFRDAINVDASNGVAYYWFAFAEARLGESQVALGLLDKAEALVGADNEWMEKINELRAELGVVPPPRIVPDAIDQGF